jgi:hypothetical protein
VKIAGEQGRYAVGHNGVSSYYCKLLRSSRAERTGLLI